MQGVATLVFVPKRRMAWTNYLKHVPYIHGSYPFRPSIHGICGHFLHAFHRLATTDSQSFSMYVKRWLRYLKDAMLVRVQT